MTQIMKEVPLKERYFEDYKLGECFEFGDFPVSEDELIEFSKKYDPQTFHTDPEAAKASAFDGLISSGWMTGAVMCRLLVEHFLPPAAALGSPGLNSLIWKLPVRPGDRLYERVTILSLRRSESKPDRGFVELLQEGFNQHGELVIQMKGVAIMRCRGQSGMNSPRPTDLEDHL